MASDGGSEAIRPATAEEEASKRNTDCVYFLASPLTCKKGSDCEYRHNEGARINPRDCWYWLKGNCLNPKCSFRHPPLDSWFATPMPTSGPLQLLQTAPTILPAACPLLSNNINKKSSPCYYFQRGQCLKGEWCPFIHGPQAFSGSVSQQVAKASTCLAEPPATIKDTQQNINMQRNAVKLNRDKPKATVEMPVILPPAKVVIKDKNASEDELLDNKVLPPNSLNGEPPALPHNPHNFVPTSGAYSVNRQLQPLDEQPVEGRDTDELLHEYSPGFDVLVEGDIEDPDFFHNEDNFGRVSAHGGHHLEPENDRHKDYKPMTRIERDPCNGIGKYDNYEQTLGRYGWDPKTSDRRLLDKPSSLERRVLDRETTLGGMDDSDLRHQLRKKGKLNGSRSTGGFDGHGDYYQRDDLDSEKRDYGHHSRDQRQFSPEKSISIRLQGRITFPGRSSVDIASNLNLEKERGRRPRDRHSPVRRMNHQTKRPGRIKQQLSEDFSKDTATKSIRNKPTIGDDTNSPDFAGPKSLAELKGARINGHSYERSIKSIIANTKLNGVKTGEVERLRESEDSLSLEGPKPPSDVLKRKRELAYTDSEISTDQHENIHAGGEPAVNDSELVAPSLQSVTPLDAEKETNHAVDNHERHKFRAVEEGLTTEDDENLTNEGQSSAKADAAEIEDGMDLENVEDELENYNQRDEDLGHGDENTFQGDEDEFDDEDDFARKVSVMLS